MALLNLKVVEFAGLAPGPFTGLVLADNGADVIRVDRPSTSSNDILCRGKRSIAINLKTKAGLAILKRLVTTADVVIDPFRPGVLERRGLGPDIFLGNGGLNKCLIYARIAGFPNMGPHNDMAGHDINYIALSGILSMLPGTDGKPVFPTNLLADFAGGGLMCVLGILLALIERGSSGRGQVVNVDMVSGTRYLSSYALLHVLLRNSIYSYPRGQNVLDGGAPFYGIYVCKDGGLMSVGCLEPQFFKVFIEGFLQALPSNFPLPDAWRPTIRSQHNRGEWPKLREFLEIGFRTNSRQFWTDVFHSTDACTVPVLSPEEASKYEAFGSPYPQTHPKIISFSRSSKNVDRDCQRFNLQPGLHTKEILSELGLTTDEIGKLVLDGTFEMTVSAAKL
ncbi:hypothetical protein APHAL10511_007359 [Amanita phalloides]|nr:hypothetical protein APHAL10511_007359 [Amanita phalloides]